MRLDPATGAAPGWTIRVTAKEFIEAYPHIEARHAYSELKKAAEDLFECRVEWMRMSSRGQERDEAPVVRWIYEKADTTTAGWVDLKFHPASPLPARHRKRVHEVQATASADLRSIIRGACLNHCAVPRYRRRRHSLRRVLPSYGCAGQLREGLGQLRRRVIEPAVKELQEKIALPLSGNP
ncbi:RepB family plasmid replication initiator protein [Burkholderia gladioli]|uniref:RepB family plasmid replication initiator protein n=1 Tax=Burkholderia gladioli TaxID=28095 RepID=UPI0039F4AC7A